MHPADWHLLGIEWERKTHLGKALPFGLCSALKIFTAISDILEWVLVQHGVSSCLHYLDDFVTMGASSMDECETNLTRQFRGCEILGIPIAAHRVEGPTTVIIIFLRIELNTTDTIMHLPDVKLQCIKTTIN